jgi:anti-anti-sigma factor
MLTIGFERTNDVVVLRCEGRIVRGDDDLILRGAIRSQDDARVIVIDLAEVETVDAGGLTAFVEMHHWTRSKGIQLKLVDPSKFVYEVLSRTGLTRVFKISSIRDALFILSGIHCRPARHAAA